LDGSGNRQVAEKKQGLSSTCLPLSYPDHGAQRKIELAGLIVELTQEGRKIGEWTLEAAPLEMRLKDAETGKVLGVFSASAPTDVPTDEVPLPKVLSQRPFGDDLTMPLPEATGEISTAIDVEAELWVRGGRQWQRRGALKPGQKAQFLGAKVRLKKNGVLVVEPGPSLSGGAELPSGGDREIHAGQAPLRFPPGTSVILTSSEGMGFYVKNRLGDTGFRTIVEHNSDWVSPTNTYVPPASDLG
jgi:hypothetical protein